MTIYHFKVLNNRFRSIFLTVILLLCLPLFASAVTKQMADSAYQKGDYQQAIIDYQYLLKQGTSAELYYNLGNAYYRSDSLTMAILAYERALWLSPGDKDIRFNLQFARSKTIDKLTPESEVVFVTWYRGLVNLTNANVWAYISIVSIILALLLVLIYLFVPHMLWRKVGFFGGMTFFVFFIFSTLFAWDQHHAFVNRSGAIIMAPSVNVKKTPSANAEDAFILHEGTRVDVTDTNMKSWRGIRLPDGREGWIPPEQLEMI